MYYDLHIHSCLSPCASDEMTINNIVNMAVIKQLDLIALTDHNSTLNLKVFKKIVANTNLKVVYGVEIQTKEEVHILAYFKDLLNIDEFQNWLDINLIRFPNDINFFGKQQILNEFDEEIDVYPDLLLMSENVSVEETIRIIHKYQGKAVLAHVIGKANGICEQLGFIPKDLAFDGIEIKQITDKKAVLTLHPWLKNPLFFINSDAHKLVDISEKSNDISEEIWSNFWREKP